MAMLLMIFLSACGKSNSTTTTTLATTTTTAVSVSGSSSSVTTELPLIVIDTPKTGDTVASPIAVSGSANVFEATFQLELQDANGKVLTTQTVMATSGSGTRGTYEATISTTYRGAAKIVAYEESAKDGSRVHETSVSVTVQ